MGKSTFLYIGIFLIVLGASILYAALRSYLKCRIKTMSKVVSVKEVVTPIRGGEKKEYIPKVSYIYNDKKYTGYLDMSLKNKNKKGDSIEILVNAKNPEEFTLGIPPVWYLGLGIFFVLQGIILIISYGL
ncbi:MAG: DUF3592 domain-containing protein [Bacillota bacterium]|nr:DUF3592 domain-containing protein [Bacillota bacterium]